MLAGGRAALLRCMYQTAQRNAVTGKSMRPLIASMTHPVANNQRCYGTNTVESLIHDIVTPTKKSVDLLEKHEPLVSSFKDLNAKDLKESFELLTAEIADKLPKKSPEGECLVVVLSLMQNQDLLRNEQIKSLCIDLLRKQNFNALGYIASFAKKLNLPWLRLAVIEKIEAAIPELGTQSRADVHSAYVYLSMGLVSQETSLILDARLHAFMDKLNFQAMVKILHTFAVMNRRNMDVINPLVFAMSCKSATVTPTQLTNLYYASSTLKGLLSHGQLHTTSIVDIYDRAFKTKCLRMTTTDNDGVLTFDKLPSGRMRAIKYRLINKHMLEILEQQTLTVLQTNLAIQDDHIISMILSMGKMKWNSPSTLTVLCEYLNDMEKLTAREYSSILTTCTVIGCLPPPVQKGLIRQLQTSSINPKAVGDYLNIAWCMLRFDLHSEAILRDLLSDEKISRLVDGKPAYTRTVMCSKLLNLATVARNECDMEMPSQLLGVEMSKPKLNLSAFHNQLADMLVKCLECDIAHVERGLWYPTGHIIDFRYLFDTQSNSVVMPHMYAAPGDLNTTNQQPAPDSMKWVAVLANSYQEMTTGVKEEPLAEGRRVLAANQLKKLGYHVITIQDNSFIGEPDTEKRETLLKEQLAIDK